MLPFELPQWIDEKCTNESSIYCNRTYRYIVEIFFNKKKTIYRTVTFNNIGYVEYIGGSSFSYTSRSTHLLSLIELMEDNRMKYIFKLFLEYTQDINFFHPSNAYNSLILLKKLLSGGQHSDIMDILLRRKEIAIPEVVMFLSDCIQEGKHIAKVLDIFDVSRLQPKHPVYFTLLRNFIISDKLKSKSVVSRLIEKSNAEFKEFYELFLSEDILTPALLDFIPLVKWKRTLFFNYAKFNKKIQNIFLRQSNYIENSHGLFALYNTIVKEYNICVEFPEHIAETIMFYHRQPEQLLFMDKMNCLQKYRSVLADTNPVIKFLNSRYKIRYGKFFWYWVHRVYRPGSKLYFKLAGKYSNIMPSIKLSNNRDEKIEEEEISLCVNKFKDILQIHPYRKLEFEINCI